MRNRRNKFQRAGIQAYLPKPLTPYAVYNGVQIYRDYLNEKFCFFSPGSRRQEVLDTNLGNLYPKINWMYPNGGPLRPTGPYPIQYLVVAGGGGGGLYSGGGAGGVLTASNVTIEGGSTYSVTVGQGGVSTYNGTSPLNIDGNGGNSSIIGGSLSVVATGGGAGATSYTGNGGGAHYAGSWVIYGGANGGSGGGSGGNTNGSGVISWVGGSGISGQGNKGGDGASISCTPSGSGGGAGAPGVNNFDRYAGNPGGIGIVNPIAGSTVGQLSAGNYWVGGGGAGATNACASTSQSASGGLGGGGNSQGTGGNAGVAPTSAASNTGGGGGGGWSLASGAGGSGVVILSIPSTSYSKKTTGSPIVTTYNGNTILTYTNGTGSYTA